MRYLVLIGLIVGGLLGYYVLWSHLADQMAAEADAWIEGQRRQGREAAYESRRLWGFPYRLSLTLSRARWSDPRLPQAPRLEAEEITAHLQLWNREHIIFELPGRQSVIWREAGRERQVALSTEQFRASLVNDGAGNWLRIAADLSRPQLHGPADGPWRGEWTADKLLLHARRAGNVPPSYDLALQADRLVLPPQAENPLGRLLSSLRLTGNLRGGFIGSGPEDMLANWREAGGILDFSMIALGWGEFRFNGSGSLTIDRDFRPLGAASGNIAGSSQALDALQAAGLTDAQQAAVAKQAIEQLPEITDKGIVYREAALTAQDGRLSLGAVPLFSLPSVLPDR